MNWTISGYKTYIIGACILLVTIAFFLNRVNLGDFASAVAILLGCGFITTRAAIQKVENQIIDEKKYMINKNINDEDEDEDEVDDDSDEDES